MICDACSRGECHNCNMATWCQCECDGNAVDSFDIDTEHSERPDGTKIPWYQELDDLHKRLKAAFDRGAKDEVEALFQECYARPESDGECLSCGWIICPHGEPLHYHHDGCPACSTSAAAGLQRT